jgi:hypothetical protein
MMETVLGLATILKRFRLADACCNPIEVSPWITLRPKQSIRLRLLRAE